MTSFLIISAVKFIRRLCGTSFFVFFVEADPTKQGRYCQSCPTSGRQASRCDNCRYLRVAMAISGAQVHYTAIDPPGTKTDDAGQRKAAESQEHPMLSHLGKLISASR